MLVGLRRVYSAGSLEGIPIPGMVLQFSQFGESARISHQLNDMDSPEYGSLVRGLVALWEAGEAEGGLA
jgi:hypothetical protein